MARRRREARRRPVGALRRRRDPAVRGRAPRCWPRDPAARDFVADAFAHRKFIGYTDAASALFDAVGLAGKLDDGFVELNGNGSVEAFMEACEALRRWERETVFA